MQIVALVTICSALILSVHFFGHKVFHPLGIVCMVLNIADFGAPLAGLRVVIRRRATSTLPLPLCIANFLVSTEWFLYGLLKQDLYLITPNGIGSFLAFCQLVLFVVLPRKPNQRAPFLRLYDCFRSCGISDGEVKNDIESAAVVPVEKNPNDQFRISKHRWSSRVVSNMAGEIENVIQKVHLGDQFAYSNKLNKGEEETNSTTESVTLTPEAQSPAIVDGDAEEKDIVFPMTIRDERQLMQLSQRLSNMALNGSQATLVPFDCSKNSNGGWPTCGFSQSFAHPIKKKSSPFDCSFNMPQHQVLTIEEEDELSRPLGQIKKKKQLQRCRSAPALSEEE